MANLTNNDRKYIKQLSKKIIEVAESTLYKDHVCFYLNKVIDLMDNEMFADSVSNSKYKYSTDMFFTVFKYACLAADVPMQEAATRSRKSEHVYARHLYFYIMKRLTTMTLRKIGMSIPFYTSEYNHSTVINGIEIIQNDFDTRRKNTLVDMRNVLKSIAEESHKFPDSRGLLLELMEEWGVVGAKITSGVPNTEPNKDHRQEVIC